MIKPDNKTILIVDDSDLIRKVLKEVILRLGFSVLEASNGEEAINILSYVLPACIISDIYMPVKDGFQVLDFSLRQKHRVPVILASTDSFDQDELYQRGAAGFLSKPFLPSDVENLVSKIIPTGPSPERRKYFRQNIKLPISINDISGAYFRGTSCDLSRRGIKINLDREENTPPRYFSIDIYVNGTHFFIRKVEKMWETTDKLNHRSIGCRFNELSPEADIELEELLSEDKFYSDSPV